ncbi:MAG: Carboxylesterase NlhH [candidate division BRC1 bacterium ADurb.BinA364]|nr:MAG: Carboxylesterase NlhH [candidate division BRC1 bacterium ADurb.BinA364]
MQAKQFCRAGAFLLAVGGFALAPPASRGAAGDRERPRFSLLERFRQLDRNGVGRIPADDSRLPEIARKWDANADGYIDLQEAQAVFSRTRRENGGFGASEDIESHLDVPYASIGGLDANSTSLDIYAPPGARGLPVLAYVHGGSWSGGDKRSAGSKAGFFTRAGFVFASLNYRLLPEGRHPNNALDVARAAAWLHDHAAEYGGDPERLFLMGHSAGAHLAALVATNERFLRDAGKDLSILKGVIALDTNAYDIATLVENQRRGNLFREVFGADPATLRDASPTAQAAPGKGIPPFLIFHTYSPTRGPQAQAFAEALRRAGTSAEVFPATEENHGEINMTFGTPGDPQTEKTMRFMQSHGAGSSDGNAAREGEAALDLPYLSGEALYADVQAYCDLGEHRTATPADRATAEWIAARMRECGLATDFIPFATRQFFVDEAWLEVDGRAIEAFPCWPAHFTGPEAIRAPLAKEPQTLQGKIALIDAAKRLENARRIQAAADAGAVAALAICRSASGNLAMINCPPSAPPNWF